MISFSSPSWKAKLQTEGFKQRERDYLRIIKFLAFYENDLILLLGFAREGNGNESEIMLINRKFS